MKPIIIANDKGLKYLIHWCNAHDYNVWVIDGATITVRKQIDYNSWRKVGIILLRGDNADKYKSLTWEILAQYKSENHFI